MAAITHFPKVRIAELVDRLGGISRSDAVAEARKQLEEMRPQGDEVIETSIAALEAIIYGPGKSEGYSPEQMHDVLGLCDQIVTLAGTFDYEALDKVTRNLCDVVDGLVRAKKQDTASINVHMRAMRMVSPRAPVLASEDFDKMLSHLTKILLHHGFDQLGSNFEDAASGAASERH